MDSWFCKTLKFYPKGLFCKSYVFEIDLHITNLFQMTTFEIDDLGIVMFSNTQKLIEIDF